MIDSPQPDRDPYQQIWRRVWGGLCILLLFSGLVAVCSLPLAYVSGLMEGDLPGLHNWPYHWDMEALSHVTGPFLAGSIFLVTLPLTLLAAFLSKHSTRRRVDAHVRRKSGGGAKQTNHLH